MKFLYKHRMKGLKGMVILPIAFVLIGFSCSDKLSHTSMLDQLQVAEGFEVEVVAGPDLVDYPMFATLDETGRLFVFESTGNVYETSQQAIDDPQFRIKLLEDLDGDGLYDKSTIFADKLSFPQGGVFHEGSLIASVAPDLIKFTDTDGDGVADEREVLLSGFILNVNANSLIGPFMGPDGWLYMTSALMGFDVTRKEGDRLKGETARIWRVRPDGTELHWVSAGGMNNPVELTFTSASEPIGTQTFFVHPQRGLRDALTYWVEGGIYGKKSDKITRDSLPRTGGLMPVVTPYSRVAPSGIATYRSNQFGDSYQGNLFSAQFNTHAVAYHELQRKGASFRTTEHVFLSSDNEDFHPTDVLEDADGSLLMVETGGWFILGCPLSQVSKPQLKGSIYRIRPSGKSRPEDPYGNTLDFQAMDKQLLASKIEEELPFIADRSMRALLRYGEDGIETLDKLLASSESAEARIRAVFGLYKIGGTTALTSLRQALYDSVPDVRVAACRAVGLAKDRAAVEVLQDLVRNGKPPVQRQAATALGQIGEDIAVPALLAAAADSEDRFVRHALIHSLTLLNNEQKTTKGLGSASPNVQEAALIALDQMPGSPIRTHQLLPLLNARDSTLRRTALWVASHHPEWSKTMISYLEEALTQPEIPEDRLALFGEVITAYCGNGDMQDFMTHQLNAPKAKLGLFILETMGKCPLETFPESWVDQLGTLLRSSRNTNMQSKILELVRLRGITNLDTVLEQIAENGEKPVSLRVDAISTLLAHRPEMPENYFAWLKEQLITTTDAALLMKLSFVLEQAKFSEPQLLEIATEYLPKAPNFMVPKLIPVFKDASNQETGSILIRTLMDSPTLDNFDEKSIRSVFQNYPSTLDSKLEDLIEKLQEVKNERLSRLTRLEQNIGNGNAERGMALYFGKAICSNCHTIGDKGGKLGPDLTAIQKDRSVHDILEAIVYPSVSFVREYETYRVTTKDGSYQGIIQKETPEAITLGTAPQSSVRIARSDIQDISMLDVSLMPQGLEGVLTESELDDLMTFLLGQELIY